MVQGLDPSAPGAATHRSDGLAAHGAAAEVFEGLLPVGVSWLQRLGR